MATHLVLLGGGFGSIYAYRGLRRTLKSNPDLKITLISNQNYFLFSPMLHEVASGGLSPDSIAQPLLDIVAGTNTDLVVGTVVAIDRLKRRIVLQDKRTFDYDYLVIGLGAETAFYNTPGAAQYSLPLKTMSDAVAIKNMALENMQAVLQDNLSETEIKNKLRWIVVGGGPTGVELAAELVEFARDFAARTDKFPLSLLSVEICNRGPELLAMMDFSVRQLAAANLRQSGVKVLYNCSVVSVEKGIVITDSGEKITCGMVVWTAGVAPVKVKISPDITNEKGCVVVDEYLRAPGDDRVFVIGDMASVAGVPQTAQAAVAMGDHVAKVLVSQLNNSTPPPFVFFSRGTLVSLGSWNAAGKIGSITIGGFIGWWLWRTIYLSKLLGLSKKIRTVIDWTIDMFYRRDIAKL